MPNLRILLSGREHLIDSTGPSIVAIESEENIVSPSGVYMMSLFFFLRLIKVDQLVLVECQV